MLFSLVKRERSWYTDAMKALLSATKQLFSGMLILFTALMLCCTPADAPVQERTEEAALTEEDDAPSGVLFAIYSADGEKEEQMYYAVCETDHAVAYAQAHAVSEIAARDLLDRFERDIFPQLPVPSSLAERKLSILLRCMEGSIYGFTPFPISEQGPVVCLNALYPEDLSYSMAHEYQHLCAYDACMAGNTVLSEGTDELLSDMFCQLVFPDHGFERSILSEARTRDAQNRIEAWGSDALSHVYDLLWTGYSEEEMLSAMENQ